MISNKFRISGILLCLLYISLCGYTQEEFSMIRSRICTQLTEQASDNVLKKEVAVYLMQLQKDGSWADIDYKDSAVVKWKPGEHLDRIKNLAIALTKKDNPFYESVPVYEAINAALRFWYGTDPKSSNWWHNEIATPQSLGEILLLMQTTIKQLPPQLQDSLVERMKRGNPYIKTGANKLDIAIHYLYRACVTKNKQLMDSAVEQAFQPVAFTNEEGLQYDFSYMQHGPQLQISGYGLVFLNGEYKVASWLQGTSYGLPDARLKLLSSYLLSSFIPAIRGRYIDFNTEGRGISRPGILDKQGIALKQSLFQNAMAVGTAEDREVMHAAVERINEQKPPSYNVKPLHTIFWKGDYTLHVRPAYSFNVRMVSARTKRTEMGNGENLLGTFLADGSTNILRTGREYYNIMPIWEWDKIPGITCRDFNVDQPMKVQWGEMGSTQFAGGVSDSLYGASAYVMNYNGVKAKKAWFFFDKEVVSLGSGINSQAGEHIVSTVNQCWLKGEALVSENKKTKPVPGAGFKGKADWVWHDSIGYFFPMQHNMLFVSKDIQTGSWHNINAKNAEKEVSGKVFKMWINHGARPEAGSYAFITVPGIDAGEMNTYSTAGIHIISNNDSVQAVVHKGLNKLQAVFYEPSVINDETVSIAVDHPCIIMLANPGKNMHLYVCDPTRQYKSIRVTIRNASDGFTTQVVCDLPQGNFSGSTAGFPVK